MSNSYDIAIVGAGPAGMAAAITASKAGASVVVLDEKPQGGGVIYKNVCNSPLPDPSKMGVEYTNGRALVEEFTSCTAEKLFDASIWHVGENGEILFTRDKQTHSVTAKEIIVCSGSMERPFPVPGWELSGVMSAGSAQVMLKSEALVREDAVFAGTGPLLYLIVAQYIRLGVKVKALIDTTPMSGYVGATPKFPGAISQTPMLMKGIGMLGSIYKAGVPVYRSAENIRIDGEEGVTGIRFNSGGKEHTIDTSHVFLHQGVIPNLNITKALNLKHEWSEQQLCWSPKIDHWGQSSALRISVAGDCSKVVGAEGSIAMGKLSSLNLLSRLGYITETQRNSQAEPALHKLKQQANFRKFIDALYRPLDADRIPQAPETVVCRCEEVTLKQLKEGFEKGARDPNAMKVLTRSGMGPCQGRQCGHTVTELLANWRGEPAKQTGYYNLRSPGRLLNLTELSKFSKIEPKPTTKAGGVQ